jgi:ABC-type enterobactin transport system permease subunit
MFSGPHMSVCPFTAIAAGIIIAIYLWLMKWLGNWFSFFISGSNGK